MDLRAWLADRREPVFLYGTTPPRAGSRPEQVAEAADKLAARVRGLPLDGLVVYDIQDESGRTSQRDRNALVQAASAPWRSDSASLISLALAAIASWRQP